MQAKFGGKEPPLEKPSTFDQMRAHEALLAGDPLHPPGWKGKGPHSGSPGKKKGRFLKPLPRRGGKNAVLEQADPDAGKDFDDSLAVDDDDPDRLITDKYTQGAYQKRLKMVEKSIDLEDEENEQTRKARKKKRSTSKKAEPRFNIVEKHLDPAVRIKVSESVRSKSKLTEPSREAMEVADDPSFVNMDTSKGTSKGSGDVPPNDSKDKVAVLNQNSGEIKTAGVNADKQPAAGQ